MTTTYVKKPWLAVYPSEIPSDIEAPENVSINDVFDKATEKWRKKTAILYYGNKITYEELRDKVDRFASALAHLGVRKGDRVAFLLLNSPEYIIAFFGVLKLGAIVTSISPVYVSSEIRHQLKDSGAEHLICLDILYESIEKAGISFKNVILTNISDSLPKFRKIIGKSILRGVYQKMSAPSPEIVSQKGFHRLHNLLKKFPPEPPRVSIEPREDCAWLPYTGGTTGMPKGVMITHYNIVVNDTQMNTFINCYEDGKEVLLGYMPFYHVAGFVSGPIAALFHGFTSVILTTPEIDDILSVIAKHRVSSMLGAPAIFEALKDYDKTAMVNWNEVKIVMSAADALHESTAKGWKARTGVDIHEYYGQTELTCGVIGTPLGKAKVGSIGVPQSSTIASILDVEKDVYMDIGEKGELAVSGPQMSKGYWNNLEATRECQAKIDGITWWRTGDIGNMDEDGYFYIYDRKKDLIKYKGLQVLAREVEEVLKTHPKIKEAGVIGVPDIKVGQNVKAYVVLESDARGDLSEEEIADYCKGKLAHYKTPRVIEFVGEIPKTDIGKVSRRELREEDL